MEAVISYLSIVYSPAIDHVASDKLGRDSVDVAQPVGLGVGVALAVIGPGVVSELVVVLKAT
jgi:hypothetical protein